MAARRANNEGSFQQRKDGLWSARISYTDPAGERKRVAVYARTRKEAADKLDVVRKRIAEDAPVRDSRQSLGAWMEVWRTTTLEASDRARSTRLNYANLARKHIEADRIGGMRLDRIKATDIEAWILRLRGKGLADSSVRSCYTVLRLALDTAVRDAHLARNVAQLVKRPGVADQDEPVHLTAEEVQTLLRRTAASRYHEAVVLAFATGARRGEVLALRWRDVDLDRGEVSISRTVQRLDGELVFGQTKGKRTRAVPLSPGVVEILKRHRTEQKREQLRAGNQWRKTGLVFTTELGTAVDPRNLLRVVQNAARAAELEGVGTHTLRHSAATKWLEDGVHIRAVADLLGHSSIAVTGDIYGHATAAATRAAVEGLDAVLGL